MVPYLKQRMMPGLRSAGPPVGLTVVTRSVKSLTSGSERIMVRPYPPPTLAEVA